MKKTRRNRKPADQLRREYEFDYTQARPNRFTSRLRRDVVAVVLQPDVAEVFNSSESVNRLLRSVISAVPKPRDGISCLAPPGRTTAMGRGKLHPINKPYGTPAKTKGSPNRKARREISSP
jgi:hypothetical protein